jgi:proteasome assembly chaperone (PAC2) family protein
MPAKHLSITMEPQLARPRMVIGFSGWMDGGDVSTGTVNWLERELGAQQFASIDPQSFYIMNFPGTMEVAAVFRPHVRIENGRLRSFTMAVNEFTMDPGSDLIFFRGKEPNTNWQDFAECIFDVCTRCGVTMIYFVGSVGGAVPHTREPRLHATVTSEELKKPLEPYGIQFTNYEGPGSFTTYLMSRAMDRQLPMVSLVAEVPAYIQDRNPKSIEAVTRKLASILGLQVSLDELRTMSDEWERRLGHLLKEKPDILEHIQKLEEDYDNEIFDTQMGDLRDWLEQKGIRLD